MKVLFVHDGIIGNYENQNYSVHYKNELVDRYKKIGQTKVSFLMRQKKLNREELSKYTPIDHPLFHFIKIPNFKSIKNYHRKNEAKTIINNAVAEHDVIICRLPSAAGVLAFKEAKKKGKPVLVEGVACVFDALWNYDWRGKLLAHYKYYKYKTIFKQATHVIYVTNEFLQRRYPTNGKSIGCSDVVLHQNDENNLKKRIKRIKVKYDNEPLLLSTVAAVDVIYKGQADVIKAIAKLRKENVKVLYQIVGQGNPKRLQELIDVLKLNNQVKIIGPLAHDQIFDYLKIIDVYIQPSNTEGLPRAVVEAMSVGCPVIGTNAGGIPELIQKEYIYKKGNINELVNKIKNLTEEDLISSAEANFHKSQDYQKDHLNKKREDFYSMFLKDHHDKT